MEFENTYPPPFTGEGDREAVEGAPSVTPMLRIVVPPPPLRRGG